jgi:hypothetical protein
MRIKCAAIKLDGTIYLGKSHFEIVKILVKLGLCERYPGGVNQGFVTENGAYVGRKVALQIAIMSGQVVEGKTINKRKLFSEDLRRNDV